MKEISLKDLLDTTFTINEKGEMVGEFTLKRINKIGDILTEQLKEIERLNNIINKALRKLRASKDHFKTENENNAVTFTIKILEEVKNNE